MKKAIIYLGFLLVSFSPFLSAQSHGQLNGKLDSDKSYYRDGDELWLNDTTIHYEYINEAWIENERRIISSRDGLGQELQTIWEKFDIHTENWIPTLKNNKAYYYFDDTVFIKENITFHFNQEKQSWEQSAYQKFNTKGQLTERISLDWDSSQNIFSNGVKEMLTWNSSNELVMNMIYAWDSKVSDWRNDQKWSYVTKEGSKIENHAEWNEETQDWINQSKTTSNFDDSDHVNEEVIEFFDEKGNDQLNKAITRRIYSENGELKELVRISKSSSFENAIRERNYYSADGKLLKKVIFSKNGSLNDWRPVKEIHHKYNIANGRVSTIERRWNNEQEQWVPLNRELRELNEIESNSVFQVFEEKNEMWVNVTETVEKFQNGQLIESISSKWDHTNKEWVPAQKQLFGYDQNNMLEANSLMFYNEVKGRWSTHSESLWQYDDGGNLIEFEFVTYDENGISSARRSIFGWHMFSLSKTESKENYTIDIFPNPTKGVLHIKSIAGTLSRIAILDQYGRLIEAISLDQQSTTVDISHLQAGNYFIECRNGIKKNIFKVVKL